MADNKTYTVWTFNLSTFTWDLHTSGLQVATALAIQKKLQYAGIRAEITEDGKNLNA